MLINILLFIVGLICLIKGGDWLVDGATGIAKKLHIPELIIGATIVSIGTTLPEVMVSATDAIAGHGEIAYGNALGSIICNAALIAAITIAIKPGKVGRKALVAPLAFFFVSIIIYILSALTGTFTRIIGIVFLLIFVVYMAYTIIYGKKHPDEIELEEESEEKEESEKKSKIPQMVKFIILLVIGAALIAVGARLLVTYGTKIAEELGVPEKVIALTFVALGTSLPELVTAITSLAKGHGSLSLGNVIGANLFNVVLVTGVSATLAPFNIPVSTTIMGIPSSYIMDIPVMVLVMLLLSLPALIKGKLYRAQGIMLLLIYAAFTVATFVI